MKMLMNSLCRNLLVGGILLSNLVYGNNGLLKDDVPKIYVSGYSVYKHPKKEKIYNASLMFMMPVKEGNGICNPIRFENIKITDGKGAPYPLDMKSVDPKVCVNKEPESLAYNISIKLDLMPGEWNIVGDLVYHVGSEEKKKILKPQAEKQIYDIRDSSITYHIVPYNSKNEFYNNIIVTTESDIEMKSLELQSYKGGISQIIYPNVCETTPPDNKKVFDIFLGEELLFDINFVYWSKLSKLVLPINITVDIATDCM